MSITVDVKPDLSRFVQATEDEIFEVLSPLQGLDDSMAMARALLERYVLLPR